MVNGADSTHRTGRGEEGRGRPAAFSESQRIWLLERDLDENDKEFEEFRKEITAKLGGISARMSWLVGIAFLILVSITSVLVTVIASR